ncbi:uncharacterized protein LOC144629183 [Oculina patagonica]
MFILKVVLIVVVLSGSDAALPDVGSCTFMEYFCSARTCTTVFVKGNQKDPLGNCSVKYNQMVNCVVKTLKICHGDVLSDSQLEGIVRQNFKEDELCSNGGLEVPTMPPLIGSPCSGSFSSEANTCAKTFHEKFAANKSDPSLCMENAKAKQCLNKLIASDCTFPSVIQEMFDLSFSDYNPFCADNRDPGATGSDQCDGVRDLSVDPSKKPTIKGAAAHLKSSVLRALLFSLVSLLFFVKI